MLDLVNKVCTDMVTKLQDLEKKAQNDAVYYKGAREAVVLVVSELRRAVEEQRGRQQQQPAPEGREGGKQSSLSEIRKERTKRQKAAHQAEQA